VAKYHSRIILWRGLAIAVVAFLVCHPRAVNASVAPEVLFGADNAGDNETSYYICAGDVGSRSVKFTADTEMIVKYVQFAMKSNPGVINFDLYLDVRLGASPTSTIFETYSITSTFSTSMTEYQIDITPDLLWLETGDEVNFTFRMGGAGSCITNNQFIFRASGSDNDEEMSTTSYSGSWLTTDGVYLLGLGDTTFMLFDAYSTSTDPYGYFEPYASSSYAFTDPDFGWFGNAIVDALKYLFVGPFNTVNDWFQLQLQNARYRSPGGYVIRFQEAWQNELTDAFESSSSTTINATLRLPDGDHTAPIFDNEFATSNGFDLNDFRNISTYIFWFLYVLYFYHRSLDFIDDLTL